MAQPLSVPLQQGAPPAGGDMVFGGPPPGAGFRGGPGPFLLPPGMMLIATLVTLVFVAVAFWFIFKKAGYSGVLGLLMAVPLVNIGMLFFLAFSEWPIAKTLREQRAIASMHAAEAEAAFAAPAAVAGAD